jgi:mono/diheme cytochrome c family protein
MTPRILILSLAVIVNSTTLADTSFQRDVMPILNQRCVMCHIPGAALGGLDLYSNPWTALVGAKSTQSALMLVEPDEPDKSYFYLKLTKQFLDVGGSGLQMPIQQEALDAEQLGLIRMWIEQGAQNN